MPSRLAAVLAVAAVACAVFAASASPSPRLIKGLFDEANTLYGDPDRTFPLLKQLRTGALRVNLYWGGRYGVARRRPANPGNPEDPAYNWALYDRTVNYAQQYGMKVVLSIWGTPRWANGRQGLRVAPRNERDLRLFAYAAARRYSGRWLAEDGRGLPRVDHWLAWNEPNNPIYLAPQYRRVRGKYVMWSARQYAKICNAVVRGVNATRIRSQKVACGVTGPRGNNRPASSRPSVSPLAFVRAMKRAGARGFDAYAHHPYYGRPSETPATRPTASTAVTLGNINVLIAEVTRLYGRKPIWITEYGYQTNPPDRLFGVSFAKQALYLRQAFAIARKHPRIDMMLWFLLKDDTNANGWQSGLMTGTGRKKPSWVAFQRVR
ncbi:MAG: glycosyl hydrolase [Spirillospora sp.]